jgi:hypothetical protein
MMRRRDYSEEGRPIDPGGSGPSEIGPRGVPRARAFKTPSATPARGRVPSAGGNLDDRFKGIIRELRQLASALDGVAAARQALSQAETQIKRARDAARQARRN